MTSTVEDLLAPPGPRPTEMPADGTPTVIGGRYHTLHPESGRKVAFQRASNFAKVLSDDFGLQQWMMRMVLLGAAMRPDLTAQAIAVGASDTRRLNELADSAKEAAGGSRGANLGTAMHSLIERVESGEEIGPLPAEMATDLEAYRSTLAENGVSVRRDLIERIVCCPELAVTGKLDAVASVEAWGVDVVADNKTGRYLKWLEWAIQLAVYARAPFMWEPGTGWVDKPVVDLERALIVHLPIGAGVCGLHVLDIAAGWEACQQAVIVKRWRYRKDLARPLDAVGRGDAALTTLLEDSLAEVAAAAPAVDDGHNNPRFIAERVEWNRGRLSVVLDRLAGAPLPVARPAELPAPGEAYPTWREVEVLEAWVTELEKATTAPFPDAPPQPDDPFAAWDTSGQPVDTADVTRIVKPDTDPTIRTALKLRFDKLPGDIKHAATAVAKEAGVADVEHLDIAQCAALEKIIARAEVDHGARLTYVASRLQAWGDEDAECFRAIVAGDRPLELLEVDDVERLDCLLDAVEALTVAIAYDEDDGTLKVHPAEHAIAAMCARYDGSKAAALNAAKTAADRHHRPRPRSTVEAAADPVLVALIAHPRSKETTHA